MAGPVHFLGESLPVATRSLTIAIFVVSLIVFILRLGLTADDLKQLIGYGGTPDASLAFPWLAVIPGYVLWRPWTLATAMLVEFNLIEIVFSCLSVALGGRYLERVWGRNEFLKFVAVVVVVSNVMAVFVSIGMHIVMPARGNFIYGQSYHGTMALQAAFLVAFTQLIPEHQVQVLGGLLKLKVKSLPMLYVTVSNVMCLIGYTSPWILIQFGWLIGWSYLRFIKDGGDRSETFAFASWFPPFAQKYVARLSNIVFGLAVKVRLLKPWTDIEQGSYTLAASSSGNARAEAERRRAMALQALDQRLASSNRPAASPPPTTASPSIASAPSKPLATSVSTGNLQQARSTEEKDTAAPAKTDDVVFDAAQE